MSTSSGSSNGNSSESEKNKIGGASKSGAGISPGEVGYQTSIGGAGQKNGGFGTEYSKMPAGSFSSGIKTDFDKIEPTSRNIFGYELLRTTTPIPTSSQFGEFNSSGKTNVPLGGTAGGALDTTVKQPTSPATDGGENTSVTTPRSDSSVTLAGQVGTKPNRSPSRSNNFVSMIGGAGGLGRRSEAAKRTLIGGA